MAANTLSTARGSHKATYRPEQQEGVSSSSPCSDQGWTTRLMTWPADPAFVKKT